MGYLGMDKQGGAARYLKFYTKDLTQRFTQNLRTDKLIDWLVTFNHYYFLLCFCIVWSSNGTSLFYYIFNAFMVFRSFTSLTGSVLQDLISLFEFSINMQVFPHLCSSPHVYMLRFQTKAFSPFSLFVDVIYYIFSISSIPCVTIDRRCKHSGREQPNCFVTSGITIETDRPI